ncbi:homeobox-DDT domain protein RLT3 [Cucurbita maxima]|uniref:Homeobox-DDT domain protein RLT3 n=1 Tax=Cucurbita maxima TaxID=3661 RepID=A0A6J1IQ39_CUCMA|nr:homeobox-DDT domain protein RLT3 [Cucurbita maxima]
MEFRRKTPQQLLALDAFYSEEKYPTQSRLKTYAATLGLTYRQVQGWFAQKRRRDRSEDETTVSSTGEWLQENQRETKVRKVSKQTSSVPVDCCGKMAAPFKTHGIGKGLMTVWQATNPDAGKFPAGINFSGRELMDASSVSTSSSEESLRQGKRPPRQAKVKGRQASKVQGKRKPSTKNRRVERNGEKSQKQFCYKKCELAWERKKSQGCVDQFATLVDDEELELRELQAGKHIMASCDHFMANDVNSCSLCKDMLAKFPPNSVKMKQPFGIQSWDSSLDIGKKLFKAFNFLYTYAITLGICPFTLDEFAQAFYDKNSFLLGKIHMALLKLLFCDIEAEFSNAYLTPLSKSCKFLALVHLLGSQDFALDVWKKSLNPLTWTEILRQVLIAAGFCSKQGALQKETLSKEMNLMVKYGLQRGTLKGELFIILSEQGNNGIKVSDLTRESKIVDLNVAGTTEELELLICSTLSSDITLFEKISSSAYRVRPSPATMDVDEIQSDTDFGSVDDIAANASICSSSYDSECDSENLCSQITKIRKSNNENPTVFMEIDVSHPGEAWLLGLMEDEYSGLSIEEKLNALVALIDLLSYGSSIKPKGTSTSCAIDYASDIRRYGSGAKIKKSSVRGHNLSRSFLTSSGQLHGASIRHASLEHHPIDSTTTISEFHENLVGQGNGANKMGDVIYLHPMQSIFLGSDRRYNRYWLFLGPCNASDPGHRRVYFESSEDGHWEVIDTEEALCALLSVLDDRGKREAYLIESLEKRVAFLCEAMSNYSTRNLVSRSFTQSEQSDMDRIRESSYSPVSDVDNSLNQAETTGDMLPSCSAIVLDVKRKGEEEKQSWNCLQEFDSWVWNFFYHALYAVRHGKRSYLDSLARCESCHDLYWRDEKHCKVCHMTFELDFNLEERYTIHRATCREKEDDDVFPKHKVLSSQFQSLKAAVHAIESVMPEGAMVGAWTKSAHKLWIKRLRRTSSLTELLQVVADFVGAINEDWFYNFPEGSSVDFRDTLASFTSLPQTTSALAFWLVKLDAFLNCFLWKDLKGS